MKNRDLRITNKSRKDMDYFLPVFESNSNITTLYKQAQTLETKYNAISNDSSDKIKASELQACAVLNIAYQYVINNYNPDEEGSTFSRVALLSKRNKSALEVLEFFSTQFPSMIEELSNETEETVRAFFLYQVYLLNPAYINALKKLIFLKDLVFPDGINALKVMCGALIPENSSLNDDEETLFMFLIKPAVMFPDSLEKQISYILKYWKVFLPEEFIKLLSGTLDIIKEENFKPVFFTGKAETLTPDFTNMPDGEYFSQDEHWMPNVVMMAKSTLVWLDQLSKKYNRHIHTLDAIPDEELDFLKNSGFTALWLIGLWERSPASKRIKNLCGNAEAEASAYSLKSYNISKDIGGWTALSNLRERCEKRGIRLASDMVPNHTGIDADWIYSHPDYYISQDWIPFPSYSYNGENLSQNPDYEIKIEDHYFNRTDAAVTFKLTNKKNNESRYIFHGNDGTTMPWNDTAQLDFLNPETREAVIQQILEIARNFHIIRFDAAMTLAKRHIQRLWYPKPGLGGDIAGRAVHGMTDEEFNKKIPVEFWREVVDRVQAEVPDTLLLAEAFWMMESYFVRTLGMHRVYNSAFMHMTKNEDNKKYRDSIKQILAYDPEILKRYVNFMNNPDEETAAQQYGTQDKYFGVCTLLATMPGLPMFGHGQLEGFKEKYGMEYRKAYWNEVADQNLINEHGRRIFPLLKMRYLYSECFNFNLFDVINPNSSKIEESIYAYINGITNDSNSTLSIVLYNNKYEHAEGFIKLSVPKLDKKDRIIKTKSLAECLSLTLSGRHYTIMKNFSDSLYYIYPSIKLYEEGLFVSLNGYESKVYTNIYEVEDIDGVYSELYRHLNGKGISNLKENINILLLKPFFTITAPLKNPKFIKNLKNLISGRDTAAMQYEMLKTLGTYYAYIDSLKSMFEKLSLSTVTVTPADIISLFGRLKAVNKIKVFSNGSSLFKDEVTNTLCAYFILKPFVSPKNENPKDVLSLIDKLSLTTLFDTHQHAVRCSCLLFSDKQLNISEILKEDYFRSLIGYNVYDKIQWYKEEDFRIALYLVLLSNVIKNKSSFKTDSKTDEYEKQLRYWMDKNIKANYKYLELIK